MKSKPTDLEQEWFGLLDDKTKGEVMTTKIKEVEETNRVRIREEEDTKQRLHQTDGYQWGRVFLFAALLAAVAGMTCVGYTHFDGIKEIELAKTRPASSASASASTGK